MSFVAIGIAGASLALGATSAYVGGKAGATQAKAQSALSSQQIAEARKALDELQPVKEAKEKVAYTEFTEKTKSLGIGKGQAERDVAKKLQSTGMVSSTGITESKSKIWQQFEQQESGIYGQLGQKMGDIEEFMAVETGKLTSQIKSAQLQKKAADEQAGSWYLGKNILG